jgi:hypothetical protein
MSYLTVMKEKDPGEKELTVIWRVQAVEGTPREQGEKFHHVSSAPQFPRVNGITGLVHLLPLHKHRKSQLYTQVVKKAKLKRSEGGHSQKESPDLYVLHTHQTFRGMMTSAGNVAHKMGPV